MFQVLWKRGGKWYKRSDCTMQFKQQIIERGEFSIVIWKIFYLERALISKKDKYGGKSLIFLEYTLHVLFYTVDMMMSYCWVSTRIPLGESTEDETIGKQQLSVFDLVPCCFSKQLKVLLTAAFSNHEKSWFTLCLSQAHNTGQT